MLKIMMKHRDSLRKKAKASNNATDWDLYRKSRNKVTSTLHRLKTEYIKISVKTNSGDSGKIWKTLRCVIPNKRGDTSIHSIKVEGVDIKDDMKLANSFNEYFTNIVGSLKKNCKFGGNFSKYLVKQVNSKFRFTEVTDADISEILNGIPVDKSTGLDDIPANLKVTFRTIHSTTSDACN